MRNTIRKVTTVVPVLMTSCQVSEYLKTGPVTSQMIITLMAMINAAELPVAAVAQLENRSKKFFAFSLQSAYFNTRVL
jgi:phosphoribosylpyrophosphate synthetase